MARTGRSAEVVFDTRDLEKAARITEDDLQLSAIPFLGIFWGSPEKAAL